MEWMWKTGFFLQDGYGPAIARAAGSNTVQELQAKASDLYIEYSSRVCPPSLALQSHTACMAAPIIFAAAFVGCGQSMACSRQGGTCVPAFASFPMHTLYVESFQSINDVHPETEDSTPSTAQEPPV